MNRVIFNKGTKISGVVQIIYAAVTNTELNEGRGRQYDKSYHLTKKEALIGASGIGVMGSDGDVEPRTALKISPTEFIILPEKPVVITTTQDEKAKLRKSALAKLSKAERAALLEKE